MYRHGFLSHHARVAVVVENFEGNVLAQKRIGARSYKGVELGVLFFHGSGHQGVVELGEKAVERGKTRSAVALKGYFCRAR